LELLTRITDGQGTMKDLEELEALGETVKTNSLCALGQTAANPILSTLAHFRDEYIAHIVEKKCPAKVCKNLMQYKIVADKCKGCTLCARQCPVSAINGKVKEVHVIDQDKCVKCGLCLASCKFKAIVKE
ncbi:MAG: 4Fe-4S binding protein, partial [Clostridia bacterium]|nr:4Fe-4S binding protein [Clostridia bacterium]